jgi:hypothetical protein
MPRGEGVDAWALWLEFKILNFAVLDCRNKGASIALIKVPRGLCLGDVRRLAEGIDNVSDRPWPGIWKTGGMRAGGTKYGH